MVVYNIPPPEIYPDAANRLISLLLVNSFEANRKAAASLLESWSSPFPGLETQEQIGNLVERALFRIDHIRSNEVESGAALFALLYSKYCGNDLKFSVSIFKNGGTSLLKKVSPQCKRK